MAFDNNKGGNYHSGSSFNRGGGGNQRQENNFPDPVEVKAFYKDGKTDPTLFSDFSEKVAKSLGNSKNGVSGTQIRRFLDEVKRYDRILQSSGTDEWEKQEPYIKMLKSKVRYSVARKLGDRNNSGFYENLSKFINSGIKLVDSPESYHIFTSLFEAVYGFYYELAPDRNK